VQPRAEALRGHVESRRERDSSFDDAITPGYEPHRALHATAVSVMDLRDAGNLAEARSLYNDETSELADRTLAALDDVIG